MKERIKQLTTEIQKLTNDAKSLYEEMDRKSEKGAKAYDGQSDDLTKLNQMIADGEKKSGELANLQKLERLDDDFNQPDKKNQPPVLSPAGGQIQEKSLGQQFIESEQFKSAVERRAKEVKGFELERKDLNELTAGAGGALVWSDRQTMVKEKPTRPLSILDVIPTLPTNSNAVDYVVETAYTEAAAAVAEKAAKPESNLTFEARQASVKTIAHYIVVTEQIMEDVPYLRALINARLGDGVMRKLEDYVVAGDGTGATFIGLLNTVGIGARVHQVASGGLGAGTDNPFDTIRYAIADLTLKFYRPDVIGYNAVLSAKFDTAKDAEGRYLMSYDPVIKRMWNLRVVEAAGLVIPTGTALVMDSQRSCTLFDRGTRRIDVGWFNDLFIKNQFCIRGEGRFAFAVEYPEGVEKITAL